MAYVFNGSNQYLESTSTPAVTGYPFTIFARFYDTSGGSWYSHTLVCIQDNTSGNEMINVRSKHVSGGNNAANVWLRDGGSIEVTSSNTYDGNNDGLWHSICCASSAADSHSVWLDADNANVGTSSTSRTLATDHNSMSIGRAGDSSPGGYADGYIADVYVFNSALVHPQVQALHDGFHPMEVAPGYLQYGNHLIRTNKDFVGNYAMTAYNTPTVTTHPPQISPVFYSIPYTYAAAAPVTDHRKRLLLGVG